MTCSACTVTVKKSLTRVDGVKDAKVNGERLVDATTRAGFP
ncbi:MAG: heavy metal-associated domain-containing protein, partial [Thermodesulfobacteriota bacterium]